MELWKCFNVCDFILSRFDSKPLNDRIKYTVLAKNKESTLPGSAGSRTWPADIGPPSPQWGAPLDGSGPQSERSQSLPGTIPLLQATTHSCYIGEGIQ